MDEHGVNEIVDFVKDRKYPVYIKNAKNKKGNFRRKCEPVVFDEELFYCKKGLERLKVITKEKTKVIIKSIHDGGHLGLSKTTLQVGHEPFYDFPCSLCEDEGKHVEATRYCEECFVYMCDTCVKSHNRIPLNRRHKLLDQGQFFTVSQSAVKSFPTKRCLKHPGELINIFCGNHDVVCCSVCKALEHSNCTKTQHLPNAAKGIKTSKEYQNIKKETRDFLSDLHNVLAERKADISRIAKEKQQVKLTIADFRKKVNKYFDDLEQKSLNELSLKETSIVSRMERDRKFLDVTKKEAEDILQELNSFRGDNECDLFYKVKTGKNFVHESLKRVLEIASITPESIVFKIDLNIEQNLNSLDTLGTFVDTHANADGPSSVTSTGDRSAAQSPVASTVTNKMAMHSYPTSPQVLSAHSDHFIKYDTQLFGKFDVKEKSYAQTCRILDITQLTDGNILITDYNNYKLKRLDQSYKLLDSVQLPSKPAYVCAAGPDEVAVSLCEDKKVQFVSVGRSLTLTRSFSTGSYCRGMVYTDDKLYVCCGSKRDSSSGYIKVYNKAGQLQNYLPGASRLLSAVPGRILVSDDGQHLFIISFRTDNISMLDLAGNVVRIFSSKELGYPSGICTDGTGQVFVCGYSSNTLVQLSPKHRKIEVILREADGLLKPYGVYYDKRASRLLVSCYDLNDLLVYTCTRK